MPIKGTPGERIWQGILIRFHEKMYSGKKRKDSFYNGLVYLTICQGPGFMKPPRQTPVLLLYLPTLHQTVIPGGVNTAARQ